MDAELIRVLGVGETIGFVLELLGAYGGFTPIAKVVGADGVAQTVGFDTSTVEDPGGFIYGALQAMAKQSELSAVMVVTDGALADGGNAIFVFIETADGAAQLAYAPYEIVGVPAAPNGDVALESLDPDTLAQVNLGELVARPAAPRVFR